jgi:glycosyltransferase involved in cell wall biosynthesis
MALYDIGLFDMHLLKGKFTGGAGVNMASLFDSLTNEYKVLYLPRSEILYDRSEDERVSLLDRVKIIEKNGTRVSKTFKRIISDPLNYHTLSYKNLRAFLLSGYIKESGDARILYDNDFTSIWYPYPLYGGDIFEISSKSSVKKIGITLRGTNTVTLENHLKIIKLIFHNEGINLNPGFIRRYIELLITPYHMNYQMRFMKKNPKLKFIGVINKLHIGIFTDVQPSREDIQFYHLFPADEIIIPLDFYQIKASDRVFYYARLVPEKGIFEIPFIALNLKQMGLKIKLRVAGQFSLESDKRTFFNLIRKLGVDDVVEYLGFLRVEDLKRELGSSKVLVYPSHSDVTSTVILQTLSQGTVVVAYDIPMLRSMYESINPVIFTNEYDTEEMAKKTAYFLTHDRERESLFDTYSKDFIGLHSSRTNVFKSIKEMLDCELTLL